MDSPIERSHLSLTVVRLTPGWRALLSQRSSAGWRPLVSVCCDSPGCHAGGSHEVQLGSDAQNPNLKAPFLVAVEEKSRLSIQVWQLPQTKKKSKKRTLVASHTLDVRLAIRRFGPDAQLELPLQCAGFKPARVRGQRTPASVLVKLSAPADWASTSRRQPEEIPNISIDNTTDHGYTTDEPSPAHPAFHYLSDTEDESSEVPIIRAPTPDRKFDGIRERKKKTKRYHLFSDTDGGASALSSMDTDGDHHSPADEAAPEQPPSYSDLDTDEPTPHPRPPTEESYFPRPAWESAGWTAFSLLPLNVSDTISIASTRSQAESVLDAFTPYNEMRAADDAAEPDAQFLRVLDRLKAEWYGVGASLVALAGLDAAVFGFAQGGVFAAATDTFSVRMVALSAVATGLGLCSTTWLIVRYSFADAGRFRAAATDATGGYAAFCVSARVPALLMGTSAGALTAFLVRVAWAAWPAATLVMCVLAGVLTGLQWVVWGVHTAARVVVWAVKGARRVALRGLARERSVEEGLPTDERTPRPVVVSLPAQETPAPPSPVCMIGAALKEMEARAVELEADIGSERVLAVAQ